MTKSWKILVKMPKGDDRPPRWVTLVADIHEQQAAAKAARGAFGPGRVITVREGAAEPREALKRPVSVSLARQGDSTATTPGDI